MPFSSIVQIKGKFSVILKKILANGKKNILWKVDFNSVLIHSFVFHFYVVDFPSKSNNFFSPLDKTVPGAMVCSLPDPDKPVEVYLQ
jgi:hypothetical protein